jgi:hypothetical protein
MVPGGAGAIAGNVIAVTGLTWFLHRLEAQHAGRGRMVDELRDANRRLEATLAENAGLHEQLLAQAHEAGILDVPRAELLHIYAELGVSDRAAAVAEAFNRGLLTPDPPGRSW